MVKDHPVKKPKLKHVRGLVLRNYISSAIASFLLFTLMVVMFGFDLEDQIFDYQVTKRADQLEANYSQYVPNGTVGAVDMQYFTGVTKMPEWMQAHVDPNWSAGAYEIFAEEFGHFHVAVRDVGEQKLFLLFNARPYIRSTPQIKAYLQIIAFMAGLVFVVSLLFVYRMTKRVSKPLEKLAKALAQGETFDESDHLDDGGLVELQALTKAIKARDNRIHSLLERERQFNRDASHELRTPLAVATGAAEVMTQTGVEGAAFGRLKAALVDMKHLTEGILWLSRDPSYKESCLAAVVSYQMIGAYEHLIGGRDVQIDLVEKVPQVFMPVPSAVAQVMIGNLVRNAISYTDKGTVTLSVGAGFVCVTDTGVGFGNAEADRTGFGIGLSLVERLCDHFDLKLEVESTENSGSVVSISWK